jgi:hypothetical protein
LDKEFKKSDEVIPFLEYCKNAKFNVENVEKKP